MLGIKDKDIAYLGQFTWGLGITGGFEMEP
jgi:hypothetical protein